MKSSTIAAIALMAIPFTSAAWNFVPLLSYGSGSGLLAGVVINHNTVPPYEPFAFSTLSYVCMNGSMSLEPRFMVPWKRGILNLGAGYSTHKGEKFFGWGNDGSDETYAEYTSETAEISGSFTFEPMDDLTIEAGGTVLHSTVYDREPDTLWASSPSDEYPSTWTAGPTLRCKWNHSRFPSGYLLGEFSHQAGNGPSYSRASVSAAVFIPAGVSTLPCLRVKLGVHDGTSSTPFPFLPSLGGSSGLRGYDDARFTGNWNILTNLELRQGIFSIPVSEKERLSFALVLFGDAGRVADEPGDLTMNGFHLDGGIGARVHLPGGGTLRADFAMSPEGLGIQMALGELF